MHLERLEHRRLLATDLVLQGFTSDGINLRVQFDVATQSSAAFDIGIYASPDGTATGSLLMTQPVNAASDLAVGTGHMASIPANFVDSGDDYYLVARLDYANSVAESSETNNALGFAGGAFQTADGTVHFQGTSAADAITISQSASGAVTATMNGQNLAWTNHTAQVRVRAHDGADTVSTSNLRAPLWFNGGAGNDSLTVNNATIAAAPEIVVLGGAGSNQLSVTGGQVLLRGASGELNATVQGATFVSATNAALKSLSLANATFAVELGGKCVTTEALSVGAGGATIDVGSLSVVSVGPTSCAITASATLTKTGAGTLSLAGTQSHAVGSHLSALAGIVNVASDLGANLSLNTSASVNLRSTQHMAALAIDSGGSVRLSSGGSKLLRVGSLDIAHNSTTFLGKLDLDEHNLIVQASSSDRIAVTGLVRWMIASGSAGLNWNGNGIMSSAAAHDANWLTALGLGGTLNDNGSGTPLHTTFAGETVDVNSILAGYTYYGDADLSHSVDGTDYALTDNGMNSGGNIWQDGDFNYDGLVDGTDYALIDNGFSAQNPANQAPYLDTIPNQQVVVGGTLRFTATASDAVVGANSLAFSLLNVPTVLASASVDSVTGEFWCPVAADATPGSYQVTVRVTDSGTPQLNSSQVVQVTVTKPNLSISAFNADGTNLRVQYQVSQSSSLPFNITVFAAADGTNPQTRLVSQRVSSAGGLASGSNVLLVIAGNFVDLARDYGLTAIVDADGEQAETSSADDQLGFASGVFALIDGTVQVHGTSGADAADLSALNGLKVTLNGSTVVHQTAAGVHVRLHDGNDWLTSGATGNPNGTAVQAWGGSGSDVLHGGNSADVLDGGTGNDQIFGELGNDSLWGGDGNDYLWGGTGNDVLWGQLGADYLSGGQGHDQFNKLPGDILLDPPHIVDFVGVAGSGNVWSFSGRVTDDENPAGLIVNFGGVIAGNTAIVEADGTFHLMIQLPVGTFGYATAQVLDLEDLLSNLAMCLVG